MSLEEAKEIAQRLLDAVEGGHKEDVNDIYKLAQWVLEEAK